ncbi:MAG: DUF4350 domain-containing protein [Chloroflexi bacterium]|jgi:hypothetical protein|nr:DUF4350 domain-containing protein [Chloroflexota bacterium]
MSVRNVAGLALSLVVITSLLTIWFYPSIQDFMRTNPFWNGLSDFSDDLDVVWTESLSDATAEPENTILVEIPYSQYGENSLERIEEFVRSGGILILADDYGYGNEVTERLGLTAKFSGKPLLDPLFCYRNQWLPKVTDFSMALAEIGIETVVLNHATALLNVDSDQVFAWSSETGFLDFDEDGVDDEDEPRGLLPVGAALPVGSGTVILLSDPSILINSMVERDDNRAFVAYLTETYGFGRQISMDVSRLPKAPLDEGKAGLGKARERISHPYSVVAMMGMAVFLVLRPWHKKEAS